MSILLLVTYLLPATPLCADPTSEPHVTHTAQKVAQGKKETRPSAPVKPVKPRTAPPGTVPTIRVQTGTVQTGTVPTRLEQARTLLEQQPAQALEQVTPLLVVQEPPQAWRVDAIAVTAQALWRLELHALAVEQWTLGLELSSSPELALDIYRTLGATDPTRPLAPSARALRQHAARLLVIERLPEALQADALYDRGLGFERQGDAMQAVGVLSKLKPENAHYIQARLVMATLLTSVRRRTPAVAVLEDLLLNHADVLHARGQEERTVITLARARYGLGQVEAARTTYEGLSRRSPLWLEAQQELAWTWYRTFAEQEDLVALNRALGTLHTLNSPFFAHVWQPEARLLEAQILFQLCRFVDGSARLKDIRITLTSARDALKRLLSGDFQADAALLTEGERWHLSGQVPETAGLPTGLLSDWLNHPQWQAMVQDTASLQQTRAMLERLGNALSAGQRAQLDAWIGAAQTARHAEAARTLRKALRGELEALDGYLRQAALFEVDFLTAEKELYEAAAVGRVPYRTRQAILKKAPSLREGRVWPYEGEVWADELGYYRGIAQPECPE